MQQLSQAKSNSKSQSADITCIELSFRSVSRALNHLRMDVAKTVFDLIKATFFHSVSASEPVDFFSHRCSISLLFDNGWYFVFLHYMSLGRALSKPCTC
jgi:hypothetical protein